VKTRRSVCDTEVTSIFPVGAAECDKPRAIRSRSSSHAHPGYGARGGAAG